MDESQNLTTGQKAVGLNFNPSGDDKVGKAKQLMADAIDLIEAAAYFSALTPYISTYLIGSAYKPELPKSAREQIYQQSAYGNGGMYGGGYWGTYGGFGASGVVPTNTSILTDTEQNVHYTPPHIEDP